MMMPDLLDRLTGSLQNRGDVATTASAPSAAVAAILTCTEDPHVLFIHRVAHDGDPWSGHLAFPGGRIEPEDRDARAAAERETREEVGLDLDAGSYLGKLDDITGSTIPVCVSCHAYSIESVPDLRLNEEVEDVFAYPLSGLSDRNRWVEAEFEIRGDRKPFPAIDLRLEQKPLLWGLTYRFVMQILTHVGVD